jgi:hypothetical protein
VFQFDARGLQALSLKPTHGVITNLAHPDLTLLLVLIFQFMQHLSTSIHSLLKSSDIVSGFICIALFDMYDITAVFLTCSTLPERKN